MSPLLRLRRPGVRPARSPRAGAHTSPRSPRPSLSALPALLCGLGLALGLAGCKGEDAHGADEGPAPLPEPTAHQEARIQQLITAFTPLRADLTSDHHDRWLHEQRALLEQLKKGEPGLAAAALRVYDAGTQEDNGVRRALLTVASYTAPENLAPKLEGLILEYGPPIADRALAVELLAETTPRRAIAIYEPLMKKQKQRSTMPDDEFFVRAYIIACEKSGHDPVPALADVATNIFKQPASRYFAAQELGNHPGKRSWNALREILVESTGDAYLRRKAAQAIRKSTPTEQACELFEEVLQNEADENFAAFMLDLVEDSCP